MLIQDCNLNYFIGIFYKCQNKSNIYPIELEDKKINLCNMNIKYMKDNKKHKEVIFNQLHLIKLNKFLYNVESSDKYEIYHLIKSYIHFNKFTNIKELKKNIQIINSNEQFINIIIDIKQDKSITDEKIKNFIDLCEQLLCMNNILVYNESKELNKLKREIEKYNKYYPNEQIQLNNGVIELNETRKQEIERQNLFGSNPEQFTDIVEIIKEKINKRLPSNITIKDIKTKLEELTKDLLYYINNFLEESDIHNQKLTNYYKTYNKLHDINLDDLLSESNILNYKPNMSHDKKVNYWDNFIKYFYTSQKYKTIRDYFRDSLSDDSIISGETKLCDYAFTLYFNELKYNYLTNIGLIDDLKYVNSLSDFNPLEFFFQYCSGYFAREKQIVFVDGIIKNISLKIFNPTITDNIPQSEVHNLIMGAGKTKMITPLVILRYLQILNNTEIN